MAIQFATKTRTGGGKRRSYDMRIAHRKGAYQKSKGYQQPDKCVLTFSLRALDKLGVEAGDCKVLVGFDHEAKRVVIVQSDHGYAVRDNNGWGEAKVSLSPDEERLLHNGGRDLNLGWDLFDEDNEELGCRVLTFAFDGHEYTSSHAEGSPTVSEESPAGEEQAEGEPQQKSRRARKRVPRS